MIRQQDPATTRPLFFRHFLRQAHLQIFRPAGRCDGKELSTFLINHF
jgi:hypothetical protein